MKISLFILFSFLLNFGVAQNRIPSYDKKKYWVELEDSDPKSTKFIAKYEVSNREYRAFLNSLENNLQDEYAPDHSKWELLSSKDDLDSVGDSSNMFHYYFAHNAFDDYPVVNISYRAAEEYVKWLTAQYNESKSKKVVIRLPSEEEWMSSAKQVFTELTDSKESFDTKESKELTNLNGKEDGFPFTAPINDKRLLKSKIQSLLGNVSEMTSTTDSENTEVKIAKGCDFLTSPENCNLSYRTRFNSSNPQIGIRLLMVVEDK